MGSVTDVFRIAKSTICPPYSARCHQAEDNCSCTPHDCSRGERGQAPPPEPAVGTVTLGRACGFSFGACLLASVRVFRRPPVWVVCGPLTGADRKTLSKQKSPSALSALAAEAGDVCRYPFS